MDKFWMIVNSGEAEIGGHPRHPDVPDSYYLDHRHRPSILYWHRVDAEREAERLVAAHGGEFAILEVIATVRRGPLMPCGPLVQAPVYDREPERYQQFSKEPSK